jgi:hypothetical protein
MIRPSGAIPHDLVSSQVIESPRANPIIFGVFGVFGGFP